MLEWVFLLRFDAGATRSPLGSLGFCSMFDSGPRPISEVKTATGWRCAEGYSGLVHVACDLGDQCEQLQPILTGRSDGAKGEP